MLHSLAFLFYYDDKLQFRFPSEESSYFKSCRLGYNFESGETKNSKISIHYGAPFGKKLFVLWTMFLSLFRP